MTFKQLKNDRKKKMQIRHKNEYIFETINIINNVFFNSLYLLNKTRITGIYSIVEDIFKMK